MRVAVIGGGIIGSTIALSLSERAIGVTLFEAEQDTFSRTSAAGFGSLTPFSDPFFSGPARDFAARSVQLYRDVWIPKACKEGGIQIDVGDDGLLDLFGDDPEASDGVRRLEADLTAAGYAAKVLSRQEAKKLEPELGDGFSGALWMDEPWIDLVQYYTGLRTWLRKTPLITVRCGNTVSKVDQLNHGVRVYVSGLQPETFDYAVVATGLSSRHLELPYQPQLTWVRGDAIEVRTPDGRPLLSRHVYRQSAFLTPRRDGRLLLGATYEAETMSSVELDALSRETITAGQALDLLRANIGVLPAIRVCDIQRMWRGWRPKPIDGIPIVGEIGDTRVVVATGFIGLGITMAPATAAAVTSLIVDGNKSLIPQEFHPSRFG